MSSTPLTATCTGTWRRRRQRTTTCSHGAMPSAWRKRCAGESLSICRPCCFLCGLTAPSLGAHAADGGRRGPAVRGRDCTCVWERQWRRRGGRCGPAAQPSQKGRRLAWMASGLPFSDIHVLCTGSHAWDVGERDSNGCVSLAASLRSAMLRWLHLLPAPASTRSAVQRAKKRTQLVYKG